jgi:hypothetical protein
MDTLSAVKSDPALAAVAQQFEDWRAGRQKRDRIPQHLWQAAAQLCKDYPTTHVCRCLRLSFADLKKHMSWEEKKSPSMQFMEIDFTAAVSHWQLCCQRTDGAKLSLAANEPLPDIGHLLEKFLP